MELNSSMTNSRFTDGTARASCTAAHGKAIPRAPPVPPGTRVCPTPSASVITACHRGGLNAPKQRMRIHCLVLDSLRCNCCGQTATTQGKHDQTILPPSPLLSLATGSSTDLRYAAAYPHSLRSLRYSSRLCCRGSAPHTLLACGSPRGPSSNLRQALRPH